MTEIRATFSAMETGANQLRTAKGELEGSELTTFNQAMASADYWSDIVNGTMGTETEIWRRYSQLGHEEADQKAAKTQQCVGLYSDCLQQAKAAIPVY